MTLAFVNVTEVTKGGLSEIGPIRREIFAQRVMSCNFVKHSSPKYR